MALVVELWRTVWALRVRTAGREMAMTATFKFKKICWLLSNPIGLLHPKVRKRKLSSVARPCPELDVEEHGLACYHEDRENNYILEPLQNLQETNYVKYSVPDVRNTSTYKTDLFGISSHSGILGKTGNSLAGKCKMTTAWPDDA